MALGEELQQRNAAGSVGDGGGLLCNDGLQVTVRRGQQSND